MGLELLQPVAGLFAEGDHVGQLVAVLAPQLPQQLAPGPDIGQSLGIVLKILGLVPQLRCGVGQLDRGGLSRSWMTEKGRRSAEGGIGDPEPSTAPPSSLKA